MLPMLDSPKFIAKEDGEMGRKREIDDEMV